MSTSGSRQPIAESIVYVPAVSFWRGKVRRRAPIVSLHGSPSGAIVGRCNCPRFKRRAVCVHVLHVAIVLHERGISFSARSERHHIDREPSFQLRLCSERRAD